MWFISDLHISHQSSYIEQNEIERILSYLYRQSPDKIIFNGDIFDFARTNLIPPSYVPTSAEKKYGLNPSKENSLLKMQMIVSSNEYFFDLLKALIQKGFKLYFVYGNHDSELRYDLVQKCIIDRVGASLEDNIFFVFSYSDDLVYVEHGHQHDPENFIVYEAEKCPEEYSFGYLTTKYLGNFVERERELPRNDISAGEYLIWVFRHFGFKAFWFIYQYFVYSWKILTKCKETSIFSRIKQQKNNPVIPIMSSFILSFKRLYLMQVTLFFIFFTFLVVSIIAKPSIIYIPMVLTTISLLLLFKINNKERIYDLLRKAAMRIREETQIKYIVFGHNHYSKRVDYGAYLSSLVFKESNALYILRLKDGLLHYEKIEEEEVSYVYC
ncbi:MAG: metallophosphoesterase [Deltaproteobacteria bacterium]|nr:metallophosphoesterase [Deltaproteobacteria bacterium]